MRGDAFAEPPRLALGPAHVRLARAAERRQRLRVLDLRRPAAGHPRRGRALDRGDGPGDDARQPRRPRRDVPQRRGDPPLGQPAGDGLEQRALRPGAPRDRELVIAGDAPGGDRRDDDHELAGGRRRRDAVHELQRAPALSRHEPPVRPLQPRDDRRRGRRDGGRGRRVRRHAPPAGARGGACRRADLRRPWPAAGRRTAGRSPGAPAGVLRARGPSSPCSVSPACWPSRSTSSRASGPPSA